MPTYQYACTECGHAFEQFQSFSDDALTECPECQGRLRKVFNAVGVVFKGSGFYRNDSPRLGDQVRDEDRDEDRHEDRHEGRHEVWDQAGVIDAEEVRLDDPVGGRVRLTLWRAPTQRLRLHLPSSDGRA